MNQGYYAYVDEEPAQIAGAASQTSFAANTKFYNNLKIIPKNN